MNTLNTNNTNLTYGVGVNDATEPVSYTDDSGVRRKIPAYVAWHSMLCRCYADKFTVRRPTYVGCSVCPEWHLFSNFKRWFDVQDSKGKQLDKDLLIPGNKVYSPSTCCFIIARVKSVLSGPKIGKYPRGVTWRIREQKYSAQMSCKGPKRHLGYFDNMYLAHHTYMQAKADYIDSLALAEHGDIAESLLTLAKSIRLHFME